MGTLGYDNIRQAMVLTASKLWSDAAINVDVVLVGGAAGVLAKHLPAGWSTVDVDLMQVRPAGARDQFLEMAALAGEQLGLHRGWVNDDVGLYKNSLPVGWDGRLALVWQFDRLTVSVVSRIDFIVMKFLAHRSQDIEHLKLMNLTSDELVEAQRHIDLWREESVENIGTAEQAAAYIKAWVVA